MFAIYLKINRVPFISDSYRRASCRRFHRRIPFEDEILETFMKIQNYLALLMTFSGDTNWRFDVCINVPMSWRISSFVSISCSSFSSGESRSEFKINPCQFVRVFANLWTYCNWLFGHNNGNLVHVLELSLDALLESKNHRKAHTVATVYVNEMKAIFYSTIRAFGRREADLITPKRLGFANAIRF